jgi:hypothetical protein
MLSQLITSLNLSLPFDTVIAACTCTAFWGQCHLGELLPFSSAATSSTPFPVCSGFKRSICNPESCTLYLPHTKTHTQGKDIVFVDQNKPINPITLLKNHIHVSQIARDNLLFSYGTSGTPSILTKSTFLQRCNTIWLSFGYPHFSRHSFRIGGTTELLITGTPPDIVKATGRWSSKSFHQYWRSLKDIAPHYISNIPTLSHRCNQFALTIPKG